MTSLYAKDSEDIENLKNILKETWKDIPGYEGYYQVSTLRNVKKYDENDKKEIRQNNLNERI